MDEYEGMEELAGPAPETDDAEADESMLDAAIDAALRGGGTPEDSREAFKRAVLMCVKEGLI